MPDLSPDNFFFYFGKYDNTLKDIHDIIHFSKDSNEIKLEEIKKRIAKDFSEWDKKY